MLLLHGLCGVLTLLVLDNGRMFVIYSATTICSWGALRFLRRKRKFTIVTSPSIRFLVPLGCFALSALFSFLMKAW